MIRPLPLWLILLPLADPLNRALKPLHARIERHGLAGERLHGDDTICADPSQGPDDQRAHLDLRARRSAIRRMRPRRPRSITHRPIGGCFDGRPQREKIPGGGAAGKGVRNRIEAGGADCPSVSFGLAVSGES